MKTILKSALIIVVAVGATAFTTNIMEKKIDIKSSTITWIGKKVLGSHNGTIKLKSGFLDMENDKLIGGEFVMDMTTINNLDLSGDSKGKLEGHLKSEDFFGVEKYPTAKLIITNATNTKTSDGNNYSVQGNMTIKESTHPIKFDMLLVGNTATCKINIDRSKYDVRYGSGSFFDGLGDKAIDDIFTLDVLLKF